MLYGNTQEMSYTILRVMNAGLAETKECYKREPHDRNKCVPLFLLQFHSLFSLVHSKVCSFAILNMLVRSDRMQLGKEKDEQLQCKRNKI